MDTLDTIKYLHGRPVSYLVFMGQQEETIRIGTAQCDALICKAESYGHSCIEWVIQIKDGIEVARHNTQYIASIYFL